MGNSQGLASSTETDRRTDGHTNCRACNTIDKLKKRRKEKKIMKAKDRNPIFTFYFGRMQLVKEWMDAMAKGTTAGRNSDHTRREAILLIDIQMRIQLMLRYQLFDCEKQLNK